MGSNYQTPMYLSWVRNSVEEVFQYFIFEPFVGFMKECYQRKWFESYYKLLITDAERYVQALHIFCDIQSLAPLNPLTNIPNIQKNIKTGMRKKTTIQINKFIIMDET
jgi:hypothetical protein